MTLQMENWIHEENELSIRQSQKKHEEHWRYTEALEGIEQERTKRADHITVLGQGALPRDGRAEVRKHVQPNLPRSYENFPAPWENGRVFRYTVAVRWNSWSQRGRWPSYLFIFPNKLINEILIRHQAPRAVHFVPSDIWLDTLVTRANKYSRRSLQVLRRVSKYSGSALDSVPKKWLEKKKFSKQFTSTIYKLLMWARL